MKKLVLLCGILLPFVAESAMAQPNYQFAEVGTKNFITETTIAVGTQISLDLWLTGVGVGNNQYSGGAWLDFTDSTTNISYVSGGRCKIGGREGCTGPWQANAGIFINEPDGAGTVLFQVANLGGAAPDGDGDLIVGTITLECNATGDATINLATIPTLITWNPIIDADIVPGSLLIQQQVQTTTTTICYCPIVCIYDEDSTETQLLRSIRDNILSKSHEGKELIKLYYQWSPAIGKAMEADENFKEEVKELIDGFLKMVE